MGKRLTKNARWVILWAKYKDKDNAHDLFIPHETVFNVGRHSYDRQHTSVRTNYRQ
jgi:hypothetical protein